MTAATSARSGSRIRPRASGDQSAFIARWLKVWVALLAVVVLVVVVYLIFITNALASINSNLGVTSSAVTGIGGNAKTLPNQIQGINGSLSGIDPALKPIAGQANQIIANLTDIEGSLTSTDGSLKDTSSVLQGTSGALTGIASTLGGVNSSLIGTAGNLNGINGSLVNTNGMLNGISGSLVNTATVLRSVLGLTTGINTTLNQANDPAGDCVNAPEARSTFPAGNNTLVKTGVPCGPNQLGAQNIHQRVAFANNELSPAQFDLTQIVGSGRTGLTGVNNNLVAICKSDILSANGLVPGLALSGLLGVTQAHGC
ncbi:MAG: hypothetical protein DLM54_11355 [Acidimicrobiales bacterium]|nr:MAG: hypothetical protein DLM54_11355 [Acidimicrobiales bacterium]